MIPWRGTSVCRGPLVADHWNRIWNKNLWCYWTLEECLKMEYNIIRKTITNFDYVGLSGVVFARSTRGIYGNCSALGNDIWVGNSEEKKPFGKIKYKLVDNNTTDIKWHWDKLFSEFFAFPCQYHSIVAVHTHISSVGQMRDSLTLATRPP
jgi:hypothetical protein